ncbi:MAG: cobalt ECF transporter T component CbiQ [Planctomycetes bacterium]|nr:cobalt ECF transporter T component CbiQ [Planctomycetota bacterium]
MPSSYLDRYARSRSLCHRLPARLKLLLSLAVVLTAALVPARLWPVHGVLAVVVFIGHTLARIPLVYLARRLAFFLPLVLVLSLSVPLAQGFQTGWEIMWGILFRSSVAFLAVVWLVNVLPFDQLLRALARLKVPAVLVAMMAFMYRYSFVLWDELDKMRTARRARSFGRGGRWFAWTTSAQIIGMLLIRSLSRAERIYGAMKSRGWDGRVRTLED